MTYTGYDGIHARGALAISEDLRNFKKERIVAPPITYALFSPEHEWELKDEVNNVVFPTDTTRFEDILFIYYGAADSVIACASVNLSDLVAELLTYTVKDEK